MKRTSLLLIPILLIALLLCSCNADAQDGIFSAIADSAPDAGIKIQAYLGTYEGKHYILTDSGVSVIGGSSDFTPILSTPEAQIKGACLVTNEYDSTSVYTLTSKQGSEKPEDSKILVYSVKGEFRREYESHVKWLTTNGVFYAENEYGNRIVSLYTNNYVKALEGKAINKIECEDYVLIEELNGLIKNFIVYSVKTGEVLTVQRPDAIKGEVVGFQVVDATNGSESFLIVVKNGSTYDVYTLTATEVKDTGVNLSSTPANGKINSFHYKDGEKDCIAFKAANYFDLLTIEGSKYSMDTINTAGYASKLRTATVSNIVPSDNAGKFIVATWNNSIWEIDPTTTNDPVELK